MLDELTFSGRELLIAVILATVVYLLEVLVFSRRRGPRREAAIESRMAALEQEVETIKQRLQELERAPDQDSALDVPTSVHAEAMRMAREGASGDELSQDLGISRSEADLIIALHQVKP